SPRLLYRQTWPRVSLPAGRLQARGCRKGDYSNGLFERFPHRLAIDINLAAAERADFGLRHAAVSLGRNFVQGRHGGAQTGCFRQERTVSLQSQMLDPAALDQRKMTRALGIGAKIEHHAAAV